MSDTLLFLMNADNPNHIHKSYVKKYKCPYCIEKHERDKLYIHIQNKHEDMIPEGYTALRVAFNSINNKTEGHCIICQGVSDWNEDKGRYERLCNKKSCHDKYKKMVAERNKKKYGTERLQTDSRFAEEVQKKALAGRKISGIYKFTDGGRLSYVGTYEKQLLEFMDIVMHCKSEDITGPGPAIDYTLNGEKHLYLPDYYYIPYNLLIEIKDGGDNPNNHPHRIEEEKKNKAKEEAVRKLNKYNYVRVVNNDFSQLLTVMATLKYNMAENDDTPVIMTHESVLMESKDKSKLDKNYKPKGKMKLSDFELDVKEKEYSKYKVPIMLGWKDDKGKLIAWITITKYADENGYRQAGAFEIIKEYRGYGLGSQIVEYIKSKYKVGSLWVYKDNEVAIRLYEKHGFKIVGDAPNHKGCYLMYYEPNRYKVPGIPKETNESVLLESEDKSKLDKDHKQKGSMKLSDLKLEVKDTHYGKEEKDFGDNKCFSLKWSTKDGDHVGHVDVDQNPAIDGYIWFGNFGIAKQYRGNGLGTQIIEYIKSKYKAGALGVAKDNEVAIHIYKKCGFKELERKDPKGEYYYLYYPPNKQKVPEKKNESVLSEGIIFNDEDIYYNKDEFDSGEINLCFITGLCGSGKTTLCNSFNEENTIICHLDDLIKFEKSRIKIYDEDNLDLDDDYTIYTIFIEKYKKLHPNENLYRSFVLFMKQYTKKYKNKKFICEGTQLLYSNWFKPEEFKDYCMIILGTSLTNSQIRYQNHIVSYNFQKDFPSNLFDLYHNNEDFNSHYQKLLEFRNYFENLMKQNESVLSEGIIFNDEDIYYNKDKFDSGEINLCFIVGHSGSGKSTMGNSMKNDNIEYCEMDRLLYPVKWVENSITDLKKYGDLIYSFLTGPGKKFYISKEQAREIYGGDLKNHIDESYYHDLYKSFVSFAMKYADSHRNKKFVCDGVWIIIDDLFYPEEFKDCAFYIKGTSAILSKLRAAKRDHKNIPDYFRRLLSNRKHYLDRERRLEMFRDYFKSLMENNINESLDVPNQIDTIVFDFGQVLTQRNPNGERDIDEWRKQHKLAPEEMEYLLHIWTDNKSGFKEHQSLKNAKKIFKENCDPKYHWLIDDLFRYIGEKGRIIAKYAVSMLSNLKKKGYKLYFLSNMRQYTYESYQQVNFLDPILKYFIGGVFSFQTPYRKPDTNIYKILIKKCKINPETSLFIDDKPDNVDAARSLGFTGIVFEAEPGATTSSTPIVKDLMSMRSLNESSDNLEEIIVRNVQNKVKNFQYFDDIENHKLREPSILGQSLPYFKLSDFRLEVSQLDDELDPISISWFDKYDDRVAEVCVDQKYSSDGYIHFRDLSIINKKYHEMGLPEQIINYIKRRYNAGATYEDKGSVLWNNIYHRCGFIVDQERSNDSMNLLYYPPNKKSDIDENMVGTIGAALPPGGDIPYYPSKTNYYVVQYPMNNVFAYGITKDPIQNTIYNVEQIDDNKYKTYKTDKSKIGKKYLTYKIKDSDLAKEVYNELANRLKYNQAVFYDNCDVPQEYIYRRLSENCDTNTILFNEDFELVENPDQQTKKICDDIYNYLKGKNNLDVLEKQIEDLEIGYNGLDQNGLTESDQDTSYNSAIPVEFYNDWELKLKKVADAESSGMIIMVPNKMNAKYITKQDIDELNQKHQRLQSIAARNRILSNQTASSIFGYNNDRLYSMLTNAFSSNIQNEIKEYFINTLKEDDHKNAKELTNKMIYTQEAYSAKDKLIPVFVILFAGEYKYNQLIAKVTNSRFSHAELSLDSSMSKMYSFGSKINALTISNMYNQLSYYGDVNMRVYAFFVSKDQYNSMEHTIKKYVNTISTTRYNFNMLYSYLINRRVNGTIENQICSSFVYSILSLANIHMNSNPSTITPAVLDTSIDDSKYYLVYDGKIKDYNPKEIDRTCNKLAQKLYQDLSSKNMNEDAILLKINGFKYQSYTDMIFEFANIILNK